MSDKSVALKKVLVTKMGVVLVFDVDLPLVGKKEIKELIKPTENEVRFNESLTIHGVRYHDKYVELMLTPEVKVKEEVKKEVEEERSILDLIEEGKSAEEIAKTLGVSIGTAKNAILAYGKLKAMKNVKVLQTDSGVKYYVGYYEERPIVVRVADRSITYTRNLDAVKRFGGDIAKAIYKMLGKKPTIRELIERGKNVKEIARTLGLEEKTVEQSIRAYNRLKSHEVLVKDVVDDKTLYIINMYGMRYYIVETPRTIDGRPTIEGIEARFSKTVAEKFREMEKALEKVEKKYMLTKKDEKTLEKVKEYYKEETMLRRER